jgi:hypothetical protein
LLYLVWVSSRGRYCCCCCIPAPLPSGVVRCCINGLAPRFARRRSPAPGAGALGAGAAPSPPARKAQSRTSRPPVQGHHLHCCTWCRRGCDRRRLEFAPSGRLPQRLAAQLQWIAILCRQHLVATHTRRARAREERGVDVHHGVPSSVRELAAPRAALPDGRCVLLERVLRGEI